MSSLLDRIVEHKKTEIRNASRRVSTLDLLEAVNQQDSPRDFLAAIRQPRRAPDRAAIALIAEVKKASPSKGVIRADFDPIEIAKAYSENGADCLSVLTDENFFQGHLDYLREIRQQVNLPLLRKDFILAEYQIFEARAAGADAVLLIAECLEPVLMRDLSQAIVGLGMTPLIELYDARNVEAVLSCQPEIIGINNRDLNSFEVDFHRSIRLKQRIPDDILIVSESGIETPADVGLLTEAGIAAMLVGESLMRQRDIGVAVRKLLAK